MEECDEGRGGQKKGGPLKKRLSEVSRRQQDREAFACGLVAFKMRLVEKQRRGKEGS
jgi:hypothetical protein